jgi:hypothetical protein
MGSAMHDTKSKFIEKILDGKGPSVEEGKSFTSERQHTAQSFNLHVERKDGRRTEGFAWSHYVGYQWTDEGSHERLAVIFGMRAVEIVGHNLGVLVNEIRDGQLNGIRELASGQAQLFQRGNPDNQPIITGVKTFPDFEDVLKQIKEIKGEEAHETRPARRFER